MKSKVKDKIDQCPLCKSVNISYQSNYRNNSNYFRDINRFYCGDCELVFAHPMPNDKNLEKYNSNYHINAHGEYQRDEKLNDFFRGVAKTRINLLIDNINLNKNNRHNILEIGPGPGFFAIEWINQNNKSSYYAIETDTNVHKILRSNGIQLIEQNQLDDFDDFFDIIVISHVLEHVPNPVSFLSKYLNLLKKKGHLFIEVPCKDWDHKNEDEPHLLFFDKKSMIKLSSILKLDIMLLGYYGTKIKDLKNPFFKFIKKLREKLFYRNINFYHPQKRKLKKMLSSSIEANLLINYSPHIEQNEPSWWLRAIFKK